MPKLDLISAQRIKASGGELLALKGASFVWHKFALLLNGLELIGFAGTHPNSIVLIQDSILRFRNTPPSSDVYTIAGVISGPFALTTVGSADETLFLTGDNTYTGITTNNLTLVVGMGGTAGSLGTSTIVNDGVLVFNRSDNIAISNAIVGTGSLIKAGAGSLTLQAVNSFAGNITVQEGSLVANHASALGAQSNALFLGDASSGASATDLQVGPAVASGILLSSIHTTDFGSAQRITLNTGNGLGANVSALNSTVFLDGSRPLTMDALNTNGHATAQDFTGSFFGAGIPSGSTALILDGTAYLLRTTFGGPVGGGTVVNNFTGDVVIRGTVTTQGTTFVAQTASHQNLGFPNNAVTVEAGAAWSIVWGGETVRALNGSGSVNLINRDAINNVGLTLGSQDGSGDFEGVITGSFAIQKIGSGTQTLGGASTYSGDTVIDGGVLRAGNINAFGAGTIIVNVGGTLDRNGFAIPNTIDNRGGSVVN